jgi:hypothetical protein
LVLAILIMLEPQKSSKVKKYKVPDEDPTSFHPFSNHPTCQQQALAFTVETHRRERSILCCKWKLEFISIQITPYFEQSKEFSFSGLVTCLNSLVPHSRLTRQCHNRL